MHTCPFCNVEIDETVALYGGTCPGCFAVVPGEETPTDPGVDTGIIRRKTRERSTTRRWIGLFVLLGLALSCGMLLWVMQHFSGHKFELNRDMFEDHEEGGLVGMPQDFFSGVLLTDEEITEQAGEEAALGREDEIEHAPSSGPVRSVAPNSTVEGISLGMPEVTQRRRAGVLSDPDSIRAMVSERMVVQLPELEPCYAQRLELDETLRGRWRIEFVVQRDGRVGSSKAHGREREDAEMEACMMQEMSSWTFDRIDIEFRYSKTLVFEPAN